MRLLFMLSLALAACQSAGTGKDPQPARLYAFEGRYEGSYVRKSPLALPSTSHITMEFSAGQFSGSCQENWPVICSGTYTLKGDVLTFNNTCKNDSLSDPVFYLEGAYQATTEGSVLVLSRAYNNSTRDELRLVPLR